MALIYYYLLMVLVLWFGLAAYLLIGTHKIGYLSEQPLLVVGPSVAIVIAVRNEAAGLRNALCSVCQLNYTPYRVILVNDRSTDDTQTIISELTAIYPNLTSEKVDQLPPGWLGKNHALHRGYLRATEQWLLFTDADVLFHPHALAKAMNYTLAKKLNHLTLLPQITSTSKLLNSTLATFRIMLEMKLRPWLARSVRSKASAGIGAFNLISKASYEVIGTHESIRLRPEDDLRLGRLVKASGLKQDVLYGKGQVSLEWYASIREFASGLMKNIFASFDYKIVATLPAAAGTLLLFCLPVPVGLLSGVPVLQLISTMILLIQFLLCLFKKGHTTKWWYSFAMPFAGGLMAYIIAKGAFLTLKNKGIYWRETFYPLQELKK